MMPALRGSFGDWIFYVCLMPISEIGERVRYAEEIHKSKALSELIQRSLEGPRSKQIADYLKTKERFFNSLVFATHGGNPEWFEVGDFRSNTKSKILTQISQRALDTIGFLRLVGSEKIFAVDGQHRLAGIKKALAEA
jgi:DNA sulfur modification protein DndB